MHVLATNSVQIELIAYAKAWYRNFSTQLRLCSKHLARVNARRNQVFRPKKVNHYINNDCIPVVRWSKFENNNSLLLNVSLKADDDN